MITFFAGFCTGVAACFIAYNFYKTKKKVSLQPELNSTVDGTKEGTPKS